MHSTEQKQVPLKSNIYSNRYVLIHFSHILEEKPSQTKISN